MYIYPEKELIGPAAKLGVGYCYSFLPMENQPSMDDQFLGKVYQFIEDNLANENYSVEDLAKQAGLSRSMLHRKLIKLIDKSASDLITEKRLLRAKEMLENNVATASEIAYKVGFNSPSYFTQVYKKYFHILPGDVRKGHMILIPEANNNISSGKNKKRNILTGSLLLLLLLIGICIFYFLFRNDNVPEKSIAILPFNNLSSDEQNQYFADGIVEDLLNRISQIDGLKVISRTSSDIFRDKGDITIPEIARLLGVNYILEGTVQRENDNIRINIQLIDALKDDHILSKQYDRKLSEVFKLQSEIAGQIVNELSVYLSDKQWTEIRKNPTQNLQAFNYYQIGRFHYCRCSMEESLASIDFYKNAIRADSNYALAYAGLSGAYASISRPDWNEDWKKAADKAKQMAIKAIEIDDKLAEAYTALGIFYFTIDCKMEAAEKEFRKAIELNPNSSITFNQYAKLLCVTKRPEKAREFMNKAIALDPLAYNCRWNSTVLYLIERNYSKALEENQMCLELVPNHPWSVDKNFFIYLGLGNEKAAVENFRKAGPLRGEYSEDQADSAYRKSGITGLLQLKAKTYSWHVGRAQCYALLGENEKAIKQLESLLANGIINPFELYEVDYRNFESDPRFIAIKKKLGLQDY